MPNRMQLISFTLFLGALLSLAAAICFVKRWHGANCQTAVMQIIREGIGSVGISAIVEYPDTDAPLIALLEEEYPRSEAIVVADLRHQPSFDALIQRFRLVKVHHNPRTHIRALYRSRSRAFRRVVVIDLPTEHSADALKVAKEIASYGYILRLRGESRVARHALTYCANIISTYPLTESLSLKSVIGADATLERADRPQGSTTKLLANRILAWRRVVPLFLISAISLPAVILFLGHLSGERILTITAALIVATVALLLYLSCRVVAEKGLFATTNTIIENFCRYIIEHLKKIYYLYKGSRLYPEGVKFSLRYLLRRRR